jgi:lipopolysaccharide export system protein LptC
MALSWGNNRHSRIVAGLKVALPLIALAILSTLFLVSRTIDPADAIPYARVDVEDRVREPRMTLPSYAGVTPDGTSVTLTAIEARPDAGDGGGATAKGVVAEVVTQSGAMTRIRAVTAALGAGANTLDLMGGVEITDANGMILQTDRLIVATDRTNVESEGSVTAYGPLGQLQAGRMMLTQDSPDKTYVLLFKDGVKVIYQPPKSN